MRRYSSVSSPFTLGRFLVFFGAWNLIGMTIYSYIIKKEEEKEPGKWKNASGGKRKENVVLNLVFFLSFFLICHKLN